MDLNFVRKALQIVGSIDTGLLNIFTKLSAETPEAIKEMNTLLDSLSLTQINIFTKWVQIRLDALKVFHRLMTDDKTYELMGKKESMHLFLEENCWILGEDYELFTSNKTLKTNIQKKIGKKLKFKHERDRPDFALVHRDNATLVIVEIKRPSYALKLTDATKIMTYKTIAKKYMDFKFYKGFLVGGELSDDLEENKNGFREISVKTYTETITIARDKYNELLKVYEKKKKSK